MLFWLLLGNNVKSKGIEKKSDKVFLFWALALVFFGFLIFNSASLGLLARSGANYSNITFSQTFNGLFLGTLALIFASRINFRFWRKYAFYFFIAALILTSLVFVPGFGLEYKGAARWVDFKFASFQPSELLKIAFIVYLATWISGVREKINSIKYGLLPFILMLSACGLILLLQPDTSTFLILSLSGIAVYFVGGGKWKHIFILGLIAVMAVVMMAYHKPYIKERIFTYINPSANELSSGYQIKQSLIAIGTGGMTGKGFGKSVQKFNFLQEPMGDSIFSVAAEEFGFVGSVLLLFFYLAFTIQGFKIAARCDDLFGRLLVVGIIVLIISQSFLNIGSMLSVLPLTGTTLPFVSHGGTALFVALAQVGIILNVSKYSPKGRFRN